MHHRVLTTFLCSLFIASAISLLSGCERRSDDVATVSNRETNEASKPDIYDLEGTIVPWRSAGRSQGRQDSSRDAGDAAHGVLFSRRGARFAVANGPGCVGRQRRTKTAKLRRERR